MALQGHDGGLAALVSGMQSASVDTRRTSVLAIARELANEGPHVDKTTTKGTMEAELSARDGGALKDLLTATAEILLRFVEQPDDASEFGAIVLMAMICRNPANAYRMPHSCAEALVGRLIEVLNGDNTLEFSQYSQASSSQGSSASQSKKTARTRSAARSAAAAPAASAASAATAVATGSTVAFLADIRSLLVNLPFDEDVGQSVIRIDYRWIAKLKPADVVVHILHQVSRPSLRVAEYEQHQQQELQQQQTKYALVVRKQLCEQNAWGPVATALAERVQTLKKCSTLSNDIKKSSVKNKYRSKKSDARGIATSSLFAAWRVLQLALVVEDVSHHIEETSTNSPRGTNGNNIRGRGVVRREVGGGRGGGRGSSSETVGGADEVSTFSPTIVPTLLSLVQWISEELDRAAMVKPTSVAARDGLGAVIDMTISDDEDGDGDSGVKIGPPAHVRYIALLHACFFVSLKALTNLTHHSASGVQQIADAVVTDVDEEDDDFETLTSRQGGLAVVIQLIAKYGPGVISGIVTSSEAGSNENTMAASLGVQAGNSNNSSSVAVADPNAWRFDALLLLLGLLGNLVEDDSKNRGVVGRTMIGPLPRLGHLDAGQAKASGCDMLVSLLMGLLNPSVVDQLNKACNTTSGAGAVGRGREDAIEADSPAPERGTTPQEVEFGWSAEQLVVSAYLSLVLGCVVRGNSQNAVRVSGSLPGKSTSLMVQVLQTFLAFQQEARVLTRETMESTTQVINELQALGPKLAKAHRIHERQMRQRRLQGRMNNISADRSGSAATRTTRSRSPKRTASVAQTRAGAHGIASLDDVTNLDDVANFDDVTSLDDVANLDDVAASSQATEPSKHSNMTSRFSLESHASRNMKSDVASLASATASIGLQSGQWFELEEKRAVAEKEKKRRKRTKSNSAVTVADASVSQSTCGAKAGSPKGTTQCQDVEKNLNTVSVSVFDFDED